MKEYLEQHMLMHETRESCFSGKTCLVYSRKIKQCILEYSPESVLDYGCGKGSQYLKHKEHESWGVSVPTLYDPCYKPYSSRPSGKFDAVICTDVLEHIPKDDLVEILNDIYGYASKFVFFGVGTSKAKKILPNGNNAHATIEPLRWWKILLEAHNRGIDTFLYATKSGSKSLEGGLLS